MSAAEPPLDEEKRDAFAEAYLKSLHDADWYIGDAVGREWQAAYDAVDAGWRPR